MDLFPALSSGPMLALNLPVMLQPRLQLPGQQAGSTHPRVAGRVRIV